MRKSIDFTKRKPTINWSLKEGKYVRRSLAPYSFLQSPTEKVLDIKELAKRPDLVNFPLNDPWKLGADSIMAR